LYPLLQGHGRTQNRVGEGGGFRRTLSVQPRAAHLVSGYARKETAEMSGVGTAAETPLETIGAFRGVGSSKPLLLLESSIQVLEE